MQAGEIAALVIVAVVVVLVLVSCVKIVKQTDKYVVERLGKYLKTWQTGLHMLVPFFDRIVLRVTMKEQVKDFDPQPVITKDNVTMQIDTIVFFQVTDPVLYAYGVSNPIGAIENLSATTLRNIIGELDLDETLTSRDIINTKMRSILDEATDPWGIKVNRVEVKNILPPKDIRDAMERQMRAEREKREKILLAEGERQSAILKAEGEKASAVLKAEGEKEAVILKAEGEKEARIKVAEGDAKAIVVKRDAEAKGFESLKSAQVDHAVLSLKSYEALEKLANGQATKLIVPSNLQDLVSFVSAGMEAAKK
ncbi:MAG: SPFH/Band 7/PHB domain protein [Bacillales bacterium]|nr:SPFH/Band 7/PHB domain protein [Bacillales bacterium]